MEDDLDGGQQSRTIYPKNESELRSSANKNVSPRGIGNYYGNRFTISKCPAIKYYDCALFHYTGFK